MEFLTKLILGCSCFNAVLLYCVFEKWFKLFFLKRCKLCWSFWFIGVQVCVIGMATLFLQLYAHVGVPLVPLNQILTLPFAILAFTGVFYFFIKQAYQ